MVNLTDCLKVRRNIHSIEPVSAVFTAKKQLCVADATKIVYRSKCFGKRPLIMEFKYRRIPTLLDRSYWVIKLLGY